MKECLTPFTFSGLDVDSRDAQREGRAEKPVARHFSNSEETVAVGIMEGEIWMGLMVRFWIYIESHAIRDLMMGIKDIWSFSVNNKDKLSFFVYVHLYDVCEYTYSGVHVYICVQAQICS